MSPHPSKFKLNADEIMVELRGRIVASNSNSDPPPHESKQSPNTNNNSGNALSNATEEHCSHSIDFSSVTWFGTRFSFSAGQRPVIAMLWEHWLNGDLFVDQHYLLQDADSDAGQLRDLFRRHPAWGTMIQKGSLCGGPPGTYCLQKPNPKE